MRIPRYTSVIALLALFASAAIGAPKVRVVALFKDRAMLAIDGKQRLLRAGQTSPEGVRLISASSDEAVIDVGGERTTLALASHIDSGFKGPQRPTVRIWPTPSRMYEVTGSINGYPVDFVVDTGATLVSMSAREARRLGIDFRVDGERRTATTASGVAPIFIVQLTRVKIGDIELRNVQGAVHEGEFPVQVLLGMSFLGQLDMRRDGRVLELTKTF